MRGNTAHFYLTLYRNYVIVFYRRGKVYILYENIFSLVLEEDENDT